MQFKIPQNLRVKDKIIGPLSFQDLIVACLGGGLAYVSYLQFDDQTWPFIAIPAVVLTVAIIFVKIADMKFSLFLVTLILFIVRPQKRVWKNMSDDPVLLENIISPPKKEEKKKDVTELLKKKKLETFEKLQEITKNIDEFGNEIEEEILKSSARPENLERSKTQIEIKSEPKSESKAQDQLDASNTDRLAKARALDELLHRNKG